jgi:hypothetical protein
MDSYHCQFVKESVARFLFGLVGCCINRNPTRQRGKSLIFYVSGGPLLTLRVVVAIISVGVPASAGGNSRKYMIYSNFGRLKAVHQRRL